MLGEEASYGNPGKQHVHDGFHFLGQIKEMDRLFLPLILQGTHATILKWDKVNLSQHWCHQ